MPQPRQRTTRATRTPRGSRGTRVSWLWLLVLLLLGGAVFAARTLGRQDATGAGAESPAATAAATRVPPAALAPTPTTVVVAEARKLEAPTGTPVRARTVPTPTATTVRSSAATPTPRAVAPTATATHAPLPTLVTTVVVAAASSPTPQSAAASAPTPQSAAASSPTSQSAAASSPTSQSAVASTPVAQSVRTGAVVALTFDAGADRGYAEDILDRLADEHVVSSFGITGNWAKANPDLVRRMAADGHLVFNHTLDHRSFTGLSDSLGGLSAAARRAELDQADASIAPLIGHTTRPFYRLPYGDDDARVAADVAPDGYTRKVGWTVDSLGWRGVALQDIVTRCLKLAAPDAVYVMHVGRASQDGPALPQVIAGLRERGFTFARVDDL